LVQRTSTDENKHTKNLSLLIVIEKSSLVRHAAGYQTIQTHSNFGKISRWWR